MRKNLNKKEFFDRVKQLSDVNISDCYQCGKCSAGCPCAKTMNILPHQIMRRLQLGQATQVLEESAIWKCVSCMTCWSRCPRQVNLSRVMEALRTIRMAGEPDFKKNIKPMPITANMNAVPQQAFVTAYRKYSA